MQFFQESGLGLCGKFGNGLARFETAKSRGKGLVLGLKHVAASLVDRCYDVGVARAKRSQHDPPASDRPAGVDDNDRPCYLDRKQPVFAVERRDHASRVCQ